jgi:hypothetical protein
VKTATNGSLWMFGSPQSGQVEAGQEVRKITSLATVGLAEEKATYTLAASRPKCRSAYRVRPIDSRTVGVLRGVTSGTPGPLEQSVQCSAHMLEECGVERHCHRNRAVLETIFLGAKLRHMLDGCLTSRLSH